ncbi:uncharacterized protein LOC130734613 [Lotus japonicus]|uniref:uncharacterized protein LOC130734613 n=1 Tax=Lotus japonicus TaxID=34305 RepID=UPI002584EE12|nr:uncharacterized protein LOC130734613 [Lotus japonicus]
MEEDQEWKHVCKFCSKRFPCGRSLGGHMRSHFTNGDSSIDQKENKKKNKNPSSLASSETGYGLRQNPKRTWRLNDWNDDEEEEEAAMVFENVCKECGKGFHSLKALFGHMKCHSEKVRVLKLINHSFHDQDSWNNNVGRNRNQKVVMDSQSDSEAATIAPNRRKRSKRIRTRYVMSGKVASSSSSLSFAAYPCSSSVSEAELEQYEVAISLMMLSRDVNPWWGGLNSVAESSENNNSLHLELEAPFSVPISKVEGKRLMNSVSSNLNPKGGKGSEILVAESLENGSRMDKTRVCVNGVVKNVKDEKPEFAFEVNDKYTSSMKAKLKSLVNKGSEGELSCKNTHKRGKFECTTCNKIFHSYQALGGHRASHKRIKGCFASKAESSENNSIELEAAEAELYPDPDLTTESKLMMKKHELGAGFGDETMKSKEHECPIRVKVFQSDQALGRHKRSHLAGESESSTSHSETVSEIGDFLDLNLPAATEEGSNSHGEPFRPWWIVRSNHKQEALVGLMSN